MPRHGTRIDTLETLRKLVQATLCEANDLEVGVFPLVEKKLYQGKKVCGLYFCLHGPRSVKLVAIWESKRNTLLFYGSNGERQHKVQVWANPAIVLRGSSC